MPFEPGKFFSPVVESLRAFHRDRRKVWRFYAPAVLLPLLVFLLTVGLPVVGWYVAEEETPSGEPAAAVDEPIQPDEIQEGAGPARARMDSLRRAEAVLSARLALGETRKIGLVISLAAKEAALEVEGVPVRVCAAHTIRASRSLRRLLEGEEGPAEILFTLEAEEATIPKQPIRVVQAPQDTAEANARPPADLPVETSAPHIRLSFDRGLVVTIRSTPRSIGDRLKAFTLETRARFREIGGHVGQLAGGDVPSLQPWIALTLAPEDARALYRALPESAKLVVVP